LGWSDLEIGFSGSTIYFGDKLIKIKKREYYGPTELIKVTDSFIHQDNLGNIIAISDKDGKIIQRRSYTPFGEIRNLLYKEAVEKGNNLSTIEALKYNITNRSFTGHESIEDSNNLIHMNGWVYDSSIGRFLSADPFIQAPYDTQSYNRYSYVKNNPLNYTDPSGYFWGIGSWVKKNWKTVVAIAVAVVITVATGGGAAPAWASFFGGTFGGVVATGALAGAASGAIMTGTLRGTLEGAFWGGVAAGTAFGVAEITSSVMGISPADAHSATFYKAGMKGASAFKAVAHGLSRAAIAKVRYGTGKGAFLSGFVSSGFSVGGKQGAVGAFKMAIVGGTASVIGGGKFANGAMGSAFQYLFNDAMAGASLDKAVKSLFNGLSGFGNYLARISGFRDWQSGSIIDENYYQNQAILETRGVLTLANHTFSNPSATMEAVKIYAGYYDSQLKANSLVNFGVGLAVPGVGIMSLVGNTMDGANRINNIYESIRR